MSLSKRIEEALARAVVRLPEDWEEAIREAYEKETKKEGRTVLGRILENIEVAKEKRLPLCQDCGMFICFAEVGKDSGADLACLEDEIIKGCEKASKNACYRKSVVAEPVYERKNTGTNLPPVIHWEVVEGKNVKLSFLLKGFGSENCSGVRMLRPTAGEEGVVEAVLDLVKLAGGKPCPPMVLGLGLGGTMEKAAILSKKALLRAPGTHHSDPRYARLEERLLCLVNGLGIGPGGLGGDTTALSLAIETAPTHIAGLPLALSVNCWAERKATVIWKGEE